MFDDSYYKDK